MGFYFYDLDALLFFYKNVSHRPPLNFGPGAI
jgi:hypothetical protein